MNKAFKHVHSVLTAVLIAWVLAVPARAAVDINHEALQQSIDSGTLAPHLEQLYQHQLDNGIRNFIPFSLLLMATSSRLADRQDYASARVCAQYADICSPDFPAAALNRASIEWRSNPVMVHHLAAGLVSSFTKKFSSLADCAHWSFRQTAALGIAFTITLAGIAFLSMVRNCRLLIHDMRHVMPESLPEQAVIVSFALLCTAPLLVGLSFAWLFPYWLMLFWSYHNVRERAGIGIAIMGFIFILPILSIGCSYFLYIPQSEAQQRLWQANYGYYTKQDIETFEQAVFSSQDDYELLFSAGLINKREQNYATSLRFYERLLQQNRRDYRVCTNAGNVYFAIGNWEKSVEMYKTAIAAAPKNCAAAYFNLARAYQQKFMFKDAEQSLADAKRLDSRLVESYLDIYSENYNRLLIDETISRSALWEKGLKDFFSRRTLFNSIWSLFFSGMLRLPYGTLAILALLLFNLVFSVNDTLRIAAKCSVCGRVMCPRCQRNIAADILCFQCQNFLKKQDQLSYKQKDAKKGQIRAYVRGSRRWISILSCILPGMAHIWKGRFIVGVIFSFVFFWLAAQAVLCFFFEGPWYDVTYEAMTCSGVYATMGALLWFVQRAHVRSVRSPEIEDNVALMSLGLEV